MKPDLQIKLLQCLNKKKAYEGFTLVELLVVVIIIGILAAIALPSFLNQATSAKQSEGRQNIAALTRAQQNWRSTNSAFADNFDKLAIGIVKGQTKTDSSSSSVYTYTLGTTGQDLATHSAEYKDNKLKSYSGAALTYVNAEGNSVWNSIICESSAPGMALAYPTSAGNAGACPSGYTELKVAGKI
jgi:type IV pilus assembly protein PilA